MNNHPSATGDQRFWSPSGLSLNDRDRIAGDRAIGQCDATDASGRPCVLVTAHATPHATNRSWDWATAPAALPVCDPYREGETVVDHGARILRFILETSCTATLSDTELDRAELASQYAICARGISIPAADRLSDIRHEIAATRRRRAALSDSEPAALPCTSTPSTANQSGGWRPNSGDREPLNPVPRNEPPAGAYAEIGGTKRDRIAF